MSIFIRRASLTVESAYIVPIVLMITIVFLCTIMMGHDRGIVYMELRKHSERLCESMISSTDNPGVDVSSLQKKLLIYHIDYIDVQYNNNRVVIKGKMTGKIGPKQLRNCVISFKQKRTNQCKLVRRYAIN